MTPTIDFIAAYATVATAVGTTGLAVATFLLARKTRELAESGKQTADAAEQTADAAAKELEVLRDQAEATRLQSAVAEAALNASVRPLLLDVPRHTMRPFVALGGTAEQQTKMEADVSVISAAVDEHSARLIVPIRNVGAGVDTDGRACLRGLHVPRA